MQRCIQLIFMATAVDEANDVYAIERLPCNNLCKHTWGADTMVEQGSSFPVWSAQRGMPGHCIKQTEICLIA
jgi:hypothetical protein